MKLSLIFELLMIFVLLAFAASKSVRKQKNNKKAIQNKQDSEVTEENGINKYCKCSKAFCNCCRDFALPIVNLDGPGCASLMYLNGDKISMSLSFGKRVITNRTISSKKASPVCMPMPGGISKFCGRVYNIARVGDDFRACLGLELQSKKTVEAAVRVSCFKFGSKGVTTEQADPLPLIPEKEKDEDDDDDDDDDDEDDDDDFGLGDDDEDDGDLDTVNDVDSADYTGFSLLGEDLLGDLFGSSGSKKSNKNKKKQAPAPSTTTTTKRPRPSRRPSRKPATRTTTAKPIKSTTVKIQPVNRRPTRKPTRRPNRPNRPNRRPTTASTSESTTVSTITTTVSTAAPISQNTQPIQPSSIANDQTFEPVLLLTQRPISTFSATTPKSVTTFEDDGLEMSLAHITGQLSAMPVTPIIQSVGKESGMTPSEGKPNYEIIETITPKTQSTVPSFATSAEKSKKDMIQIVQNLDSESEEHSTEKENQSLAADESRSHLFGPVVSGDTYEGLKLPKNKNRQLNFDDFDILDLSKIGETVGEELGFFGRNKRHNKNKEDKPPKNQNNQGYSDYDILGLEAMDDTLGLSDTFSRKDRRRQNKMMRGVWSQV